MYLCVFFFFNDTATTEIYTLSLHDALPISRCRGVSACPFAPAPGRACPAAHASRARPTACAPRARSTPAGDRKSTRLNSSHGYISYAVFCLKKKKEDSQKRTVNYQNKT